ncbi:MAG: Thymidylate kinase [Elusimicrobia bacterium]|nr:Thymidylate kinase [Elusimicrobiota bacterium]
MKNRGLFLTFEGTDGVGKSTQIKLLASWLKQKGHSVVLTREPGGGPLAEKIRELLLNPRLSIEPLTELFLYEAARVEHVKKVIQPALKKGKVVLCDRFTDATLAYQGHARGLMIHALRLNEIAAGNVAPNLTFLLDLAPHKGLHRAKARNKNNRGDRLENEGLAFQKKVRQGYRLLAKQHPGRIKIIPVQASLHQTQEIIRAILARSLHGNIGTTLRSPLFKRRP